MFNNLESFSIKKKEKKENFTQSNNDLELVLIICFSIFAFFVVVAFLYPKFKNGLNLVKEMENQFQDLF